MSGLWIRKISITNFRSISKLEFSVDRLSALVGNNDCGKSNILRALNVFFNNQTNLGEDLDFEKDYSFHSKPNRRAKEIIIKLELMLPDNYTKTNGDLIIWERRWRANWRAVGYAKDEYEGATISSSRNGAEKLTSKVIPSSSNVHSLLSKIKFEYIPAVRDQNYFDGLRARLYQTISEVTAQSFKTSSESFQKSINDHLKDLIGTIDNRLYLDTSFHFPDDLSPLFGKLDFQSGEHSVSLENRGDGVKVRHIPLMLAFIANQTATMQTRGSMPFTFIWGYEEPENNLEIKSAMALSDEFKELSQNKGCQIFLSTHSPVFFNKAKEILDDGGDSVLHFVTNDKNGISGTSIISPSDLDDEMGTMKLFAPYVARFEQEINSLKEAKNEAQRLAENKNPKLVIEGESDKVFFDKLLRTFFPSFVDNIHLVTKEQGAGCNYVIDIVEAFSAQRKHDRTRPKAAGLLDVDGEGKKARRNWGDKNVDFKFAKLFQLPTPPHILPIFQSKYKIPITLEELYDLNAWRFAKEKGWLTERELSNDDVIIPNFAKVMKEHITLTEHIDQDWSVYVMHKMSQDRKMPFARYWAKSKEEEIRNRFNYLEPWLAKIVTYLTT